MSAGQGVAPLSDQRIPAVWEAANCLGLNNDCRVQRERERGREEGRELYMISLNFMRDEFV